MAFSRNPELWKKFGMAMREKHQQEYEFVNALLDPKVKTAADAAEKAGYKRWYTKKLMTKPSVVKKIVRKAEDKSNKARLLYMMAQQVIQNAMIPASKADATPEDKRIALQAAKLCKEFMVAFGDKPPVEGEEADGEAKSRMEALQEFMDKAEDGDPEQAN